MTDEALFKSAHAAILFALNYCNTEHIERSAMSKASDTSKGGSGKGLVGLDGAAQAGIILSQLRSTGSLYEACIIARLAKKRIPCACGALCCAKHKPNFVWLDAINQVSMEAKSYLDEVREAGKRGLVDIPAMRRAIVAKHFGESVKIKELAKACDVSDVTVSQHIGKLGKFLKKAESEAWQSVEDVLRASGIVG